VSDLDRKNEMLNECLVVRISKYHCLYAKVGVV